MSIRQELTSALERVGMVGDTLDRIVEAFSAVLHVRDVAIEKQCIELAALQAKVDRLEKFTAEECGETVEEWRTMQDAPEDPEGEEDPEVATFVTSFYAKLNAKIRAALDNPERISYSDQCKTLTIKSASVQGGDRILFTGEQIEPLQAPKYGPGIGGTWTQAHIDALPKSLPLPAKQPGRCTVCDEPNEYQDGPFVCRKHTL